MAVNLGSNVAADHRASDQKIGLESLEGGLRTDRLGRQQGAANVNFYEPGNDRLITCHRHLPLRWSPHTGFDAVNTILNRQRGDLRDLRRVRDTDINQIINYTRNMR